MLIIPIKEGENIDRLERYKESLIKQNCSSSITAFIKP
jgi:hypothetical protein